MSLRLELVAGIAAIVMVVNACGGDDDAPPPTSTAAAPSATVAAPTVSAALISIDSPADEALVAVPIVMNGTANTFEAALTVDVLDATGATVCTRNILATSGSGTPGTWATTLAIPPPDGEEAATIRAYEFSAEDGSIVNLVQRKITVSAERPPLFIASPACGATVTPGSMLVVEGAGLVFEAAFNIELRDASGAALASAAGMAGGSEETPFSVSLALPATLPAGQYDLVAFSYSARDGAIENEFSVPVVVEP